MSTRRTKTSASKELDQSIANLSDEELRVGIFESARYGDGTPVAGVAAVQEFGSPKLGIPPRAFMRPTAEEKKQEWDEIMKKFSKKILTGRETIAGALDKLGLVASGQIRSTISKIQSPPLSPSTIKSKGNAKPLVDSAIMLNSITHEVTE